MNQSQSVLVDELKNIFEVSWHRFLVARYSDEEAIDPVVKYVLSGDGKRVRALLTFLSARAMGGDVEQALPAAVAVEMIHAYSLVHDDLPCMDNDDLRRGRPTAHIKFDEAQALLAGDAILTDAFLMLSEKNFIPTDVLEVTDHSSATRVRLVRELALAAGSRGMVRGQAMDMYWTNRDSGFSLSALEQIHIGKTGALLGAACAMGAICAGADEPLAQKFRQFGCQIGLVFQMIDDVVDLLDGTGKTSGKDQAEAKLTYLTLMAPDQVRQLALQKTNDAKQILNGVSQGVDDLYAFADALSFRIK